MIKLSKKALLALEAVLDIALHARPDPVRAGAIAERQGVPRRYLEQVMQHLVRARILKGIRGPRGGYRLARERRRIGVGEIVRVIGEMERATRQDGEASADAQACRLAVKATWEEARAAAQERLDTQTIEDLTRQIEDDHADPASADFHI